MTITPSSIRENPQHPSMTAQVFVPDQLIADARNLVSQPILLGAGNLPRGTVLGQVTSNPTQAAAGATNTGNGTLSGIAVGSGVEVGIYTLTATAATTFAVVDPEGKAVGTATAGTAFASSQINFTITAGSTAFAVGDVFTIAVFDAVGTFVKCVKSANDGSQVPVAILADDADATNGPITAGAYVAGEFNDNALAYDTSWSLALLVTALRAYGIHVKSSISAASPSNNSAP